MLTRQDTARVRSIAREIRSFSDDGRSALERVLEPIRELLGASNAATYRVDWTGSQLSLGYVHAVGTLANYPIATVMSREIAAARKRFGFFDPLKPEARQRNRGIRLGRGAEVMNNAEAALERLRKLGVAEEEQGEALSSLLTYARGVFEPLGLLPLHQTRVLVCDGPSMLAWVGAFHEEPADVRVEQALERLVPALKQRLKLESELRVTRFQLSCLSSALDAVGGAAVICSPEGHVLHANAAARMRLDSGDGVLAATLQDALKRHAANEALPAGVELSSIGAVGMRPCHLVVFRAGPKDLAGRLREATVRWGFTSRQLDVLALLVAGEMNRTIATTLGCSERTVEIHVTNIFDRMGVDCRAAAVGRFYEETS